MKDVFRALKDHTKQITDIMLVAQSSFKIVDYLMRPETTEEQLVVRQNSYLQYSIRMNWRITIIELSKLFSDRKNDHFNLTAFIEKFAQGNEYEQCGIDIKSTGTWLMDLEMEETAITNVLTQRDKVYSHTDKDWQTVTNEVTIKKTKQLLELIQRIISEIHSVVFGQGISFYPIPDPVDDLRKLVQSIVQDRLRWMENMEKHAESLGIDAKDVGL